MVTAMCQGLTDRGRKVMQLAIQEARRLGNEYIGTEHILLGLVGEVNGAAAHLLNNLGIEPLNVAREVEKKLVQRRDGVRDNRHRPPLTPRAKNIIEYDVIRNHGISTVVTSELNISSLGLLR